jgi:formylglycine-generating enzyme required for sulfatase activity
MTLPRKNALYPFEFETAQVDEQGQVIERKQGRAFAFSELLVDEIRLEMVAIPGGKFIMGAPESEYDQSAGGNPLNQVSASDRWEGDSAPSNPTNIFYGEISSHRSAVTGDREYRFTGRFF